jgi:hypothetical protein
MAIDGPDQHQHLLEMKRGLLPPATDWIASVTNMKVEWGIHTADSYKREHLGPAVIPPSRPPQLPNRGIPRPPLWCPSLPRSQGSRPGYPIL